MHTSCLEGKWEGLIQTIIKNGEETLGKQDRSHKMAWLNDKFELVVLQRNDARNYVAKKNS